ncbi:hypothetical protein GIB67_032617 [Kingdonia uniflora]|uniref:Legume lectin domain-containing protein n=1 Tax=Kingdonia uniflora TaxID=39325 RepID=A0A7J7PA23_9MAGN|nr:hypothetical protein GIB67_032617 [Kingdonia uniflora]
MAISMNYCFPIFLFFSHILHLVNSTTTSSFSLKSFNSDAVVMLGDTQILNQPSSIKLSGSLNSTNQGTIIYKYPIKLLSSFSSYFSFSIHQQDFNGLDFFILPSSTQNQIQIQTKNKTRLISTEFHTFNVSFSNNVVAAVGMDISTMESGKFINATTIEMPIYTHDIMHSWIDYDASSKRLEIRLSKSGTKRPFYPTVSYFTQQLWNQKDVFVGLASFGRNSTQSCIIYSWSFRVRSVPYWMHSQPRDPRVRNQSHSHPNIVQPNVPSNVCLLRVFTALLLGIGCGALASYVMLLFMRLVFVDGTPTVANKEYAVHPLEFGYEKLKIALDKNSTKSPTSESK